MQIALVHDYLTRLGGAERVLKSLADLYPKAPIYTLLYDEKKTSAVFPKNRIIPSKLQNLPSLLRKKHKYFLPKIPRIIEEWDFSKYDLVISSSGAFSHGIITQPSSPHLCYMHSPMRFAWDWTHEYIAEQKINLPAKIAAARALKKIRMWDAAASLRPDVLIANSENVRRRIQKYYKRDSTVVYPPVNIERFKVSRNKENYFLIISTLTPYKRIDLAIRLFNRIRHRLVIIGAGPQSAFLQNISGRNIEFKGFLNDEKTALYLQNCRALIFPGEEDFGITPVEAMACGKPVLAYGRGGVRESVIADETGEFFYEPTPESMEQGLAKLIKNEDNYRPNICRRQAELFSENIFINKIKKIILTNRG